MITVMHQIWQIIHYLFNPFLTIWFPLGSVEEINAEFPDITYVVYENSVFDISEI